MTVRSFLILLLCISFVGCSSTPTVNAKYQKNFDYSSITSYSTFDRNSEFSDYQNISYHFRNSVELAIENSMDDKGLNYVEPEDADIIVGYYFVGDSRRNLSRYNKGVKYCEYCLRFVESEEKKGALPSGRGSLILDLVSTNNNRSIYRSALPLNITEKDNSRQIQAKIEVAVAQMLSLLPRE